MYTLYVLYSKRNTYSSVEGVMCILSCYFQSHENFIHIQDFTHRHMQQAALTSTCAYLCASQKRSIICACAYMWETRVCKNITSVLCPFNAVTAALYIRYVDICWIIQAYTSLWTLVSSRPFPVLMNAVLEVSNEYENSHNHREHDKQNRNERRWEYSRVFGWIYVAMIGTK